MQAVVISLTSCVNQKRITYFQKDPNRHDTISVGQAYITKIQARNTLPILNRIASIFFSPYSPLQTPATEYKLQLKFIK
jgi:hypothetical protein